MNSTTQAAPAAVYEACDTARLAMVTKQRDALLAKVRALETLVMEIPGRITAARIDVRNGRETVYDYSRADRVLAMSETEVTR